MVNHIVRSPPAIIRAIQVAARLAQIGHVHRARAVIAALPSRPVIIEVNETVPVRRPAARPTPATAWIAEMRMAQAVRS